MIVKKLSKEFLNDANCLYCKAFFKKEIKDIKEFDPNNLFGLFIDNILVGLVQIDFIYLYFEDKLIAYINSFCIKEEYQNQGLGDFLLKWCINYCKKNNATCINMTSNSSRIYAHKLYKKNDFNIIDTTIFNKNLKE